MTMILIGHVRFLEDITTLADKHLPILKYTKNEAKMLVKPWITNRIKMLMKVRDRLLKKMSRNKSEDNTQVYKTVCTCIATKLKKNKLEYYQKYFAMNGKNMRMLWDRGGSREKYDQGSTKSLWAWLYGCGKYLRTTNKKGQLVQLLVLPFLSFLAGHATAGGWPPQLPPRLPLLRPSHPRTASFLLDLISPPPLRSSFRSPPLSWMPLRCSFCPLDVLHPGEMSCPLAFGVLGSLDDIPHFRS